MFRKVLVICGHARFCGKPGGGGRGLEAPGADFILICSRYLHERPLPKWVCPGGLKRETKLELNLVNF